MNLNVNQLTNANVYLNGVDLLGRAEEIDLPDLNVKMVEHKGLGMYATAEYPAGFDKMEARIKWASLYTEVLPAVFNPLAPSSIMVRANLDTWSSQGLVSQLPVVALMTAVFKKAPSAKFKKQEAAEFQSDLSVYYYKLTAAGIDQVEIDVAANVFKVLGVDQLAQFRANLGG